MDNEKVDKEAPPSPLKWKFWTLNPCNPTRWWVETIYLFLKTFPELCRKESFFLFVFAWQHILESNCRVVCCLDSSPFVPSNYRLKFQIFHFTDFTFFPGGVRKPVKKLWRDYCHVFADRPGLLSRSERNSRWFGQLAKYHLSCTPSRQQNGSVAPSKSTFKTL